MKKHLVRLIFVAGLFSLTGCTSFWQLQSGVGPRSGVSSSLVDYLYPNGEAPAERDTAIPELDLPISVGIAFIPSRGYGGRTQIPEATRIELLNEVRAAFIDRDYIERIEIVPETYLRSGNGFTGMQQVAAIFDVDVMALVSYDQVSTSEDNDASLLYWTIVGAYIIEGTDTEIHTFVDTAVFDVASKRLLFRAPGADKLERRTTAVDSIEATRKGRVAGFATAVDKMTVNLQNELDTFETRLKENPQVAQVRWREGSGGGSFAPPVLLLLGLLLLFRRRAGP